MPSAISFELCVAYPEPAAEGRLSYIISTALKSQDTGISRTGLSDKIVGLPGDCNTSALGGGKKKNSKTSCDINALISFSREMC